MAKPYLHNATNWIHYTLNTDVAITNRFISASGPSQAAGSQLESTEWMRGRIAQLEAALDAAQAARDMALSEQDIVRMAHEAEQTARREAMAQKSATEAALSRARVDQNRLRSELEAVLIQKSDLSNEMDVLRRQFAESQESLQQALSGSQQSTETNERIKVLERELEEAQDRAHKLQLQRLDMEQQHSPQLPDTPELDHAKAKIQKLKSKVRELKSELSSTQQQLETTQISLQAVERKYDSSRQKRELTKEKLVAYKSRLQNEETITQRLKDKLTPETYKSLGETYEALGAFLSAIQLPPVGQEDSNGPQEESD
ncbi:unnamed protein product [Rhizoctonia solani]|uniref:Uncharacterized protein n=1 Tax=Rhizoctonia solani TaxID=456999 RepID=A0A8H3GK60_9AGAM|nr:unnamed protein product [Rhizoctonia solani]